MKRHTLSLTVTGYDALGLIVCGTLLVLMAAACASPSPTLSPRTAALAEGVAPDGYEPVSQCSPALSAAGGIPSGCTVFTVSRGDQVFFGGNDDYINPDSRRPGPGEGEVASGSWRKLWWWIPVSYAALIGGVVCNGVIQQVMLR